MKIVSEQVLFDTDGNKIEAHGGSIITVNGKYYLYGENKEGVYGKNEKGRWLKWHSGIKLYSSIDLVSWKYEGYVQEATNDPWNPFFPSFIMDRPHIIFNKKTNKFVCWVKSSFDIFCNTGFSILIGDSLLNMEYKGMIFSKQGNVGDFDLFEDEGKGYVVMAVKDHMVLQELNDTYTDFGERFSNHLLFEKNYPPFVREAPCFFTRNGRKFIITSGTTGYYPNRTIGYDITDMHGEWKELGYTCVDDKKKNSFHSQFSSVFKHPTKDLYIAIGDRWINDPGIEQIDYEELFERVYEPQERGEEWDKLAKKLNSVSKEDLTKATYLWLPIQFDDKGNPYLVYKKEWEF